MTDDTDTDNVELLQAHTRKTHNTKRARVDGIRLWTRQGTYHYLKYAQHFGLTFTPGRNGQPEQIDCRTGDSLLTVTGHNLWPHVEDLQAERCEELRESDPAKAGVPALPYIESLTVRLWL